jgi:FPC/CPF motif-containing protein YcgG
MFGSGNELSEQRREQIFRDMENLISQKHYPCIAAVQSFQKKEFGFGVYPNFGSGVASLQLGRDLLAFKAEQQKSHSPLLSFWALFPDETRSFNDTDFENSLWNELSALHSHPEFEAPWDSNFSSNPDDPNFCFSFAGHAFFVVGLHRNSPRQSRQFPYPALIFNLYEQFVDLMKTGRYQPMVDINRKRELKFQGSINPMVENYGDSWEAIQFSGKENSSQWKCPFHKPKESSFSKAEVEPKKLLGDD